MWGGWSVPSVVCDLLISLSKMQVRSIIVTSGTLSPLSSFANELRLPFEVQVENPHVIAPDQVQVTFVLWLGGALV